MVSDVLKASDHHPGVIIDDGTEYGLLGAFDAQHPGTMHEVTDPQIVDVVHLIGLSDIGSGLNLKPALIFDCPEKRVVVHGGFPQ